MKRLFFSFYGIIFVTLAYQACKDPYSIPSKAANNRTLIVEGFLNIDGETNIKLSRSVEITSQYSFEEETGATVEVEDESNKSYPLTEQGKGIYLRPKTAYPESARYRMKIRTKDGNLYYSEFVSVKKTPVIDDLYWERSEDGVGIFINTRDVSNKTKYYKWEWEETWKFQMDLKAEIYLLFLRDTVIVYPIDSLPEYPYDRVCWQSEKSSEILIETTERLNEDVVKKRSVAFIPNKDWKLSDQYSILVKQRALTKESYQYWEKIDKNSSDLGSIYSPMPSEISGNFYCSSNPDLQIIGFFEVSNQTEKRIFIHSDGELRNWGYDDNCMIKSIPNELDSVKTHIIQGYMAPYRFVDERMRRLYYVSPRCLDCSLRGTPVKPSFWPQ